VGDLTKTCPVCGSTFDDEAELRRHLEEHKEQPVQTE
jgi:DNA repair exonuclease SbcCD ATPase subunit